jgi:hypothetical protein
MVGIARLSLRRSASHRVTPTWIPNDDGSMRCTQCALSSFPVGHHCNCSVGGPTPAVTDVTSGMASHSSSVGEGLPTTFTAAGFVQ